jgi:hypothetical protein
MFEKISQLAEQAATSASRREFLGRFGRGAMVMAAAMGGLLAMPAVSHAGKPVCSVTHSCFACAGKPVGSPCGVKGSCKKTGLINGEISCCCDETGPPPRDH